MLLAGIEYVGESGVTAPCRKAVFRLIQFGDEIQKADLLTFGSTHCFLLHVNYCELIAVKSGFASGYEGEAPHGLSDVLELLNRHGVEVEEYIVHSCLIRRLDQSALTMKDLEEIEACQPVRHPIRWYDYILRREHEFIGHGLPKLNSRFPPVMPYSVVDERITDLALMFQDKSDHAILSAYRRLEGIVRERTGLEGHGQKLFSQAFRGDTSILYWDNTNTGEQEGRVNLFTGVYMAFRNKRAHHEPDGYGEASLTEFLLVNQLYLLEKEAVKRK